MGQHDECEKTKYLENIESMNIFFSVIKKIEKEFKTNYLNGNIYIRYEVSFSAKRQRINPDAVIKYKDNYSSDKYKLIMFEYKDSSKVDNIIKREQILSYNNIDDNSLVGSGLKILKNATFKGLTLSFVENRENLANEILKSLSNLLPEIKFDFSVIKIKTENIYLSIEKIAGKDFELLANIKRLSKKNICLFDFRTYNIHKNVYKRKINELNELERINCSVFLALLMGYIIRNHWKDESFTVLDVLKQTSNNLDYEIISKLHEPQRIIKLFQYVVDKLLCKNKYLTDLNEVREEKIGDSNLKLKVYKVNKEKDLLKSRTRKTLERLIKKNLSSEIYNYRKQYELPLFKYDVNLEDEEVE
ncbi:hypothetical protein HNP65_000322 [Thermosipho japonicus]|uniref:Uncharacterized protein n=1 Tax=Thermosipho japonicus TaxID=90323 RepID=A0A841GS31_9BACT|nr:hypothetical protein [Thermosipho japonicus]MBB6061900.1 hypothetical protein [Thermosipho japonicus]